MNVLLRLNGLKRSNKINNEPAFPISEANGANSGTPGMTLYDYTANQVISEIYQRKYRNRTSYEDLYELKLEAAREAYSVAKAMLEARKETNID